MRAKDLPGFFAFMYEKERDESLWEVWLSKDIDMTFNDFKEDQIRKAPRSGRVNSDIEDKRIMAQAEEILRLAGGE